MAVSASWDWIATANMICRGALRKVGGYATGQNPTAEQMAEALEALNVVQMGWQNEGIFLWTIAETTKTITDGTSSYLTTSVKVIGISNCFIRISNHDYPVQLITREEYKNISDKSLEGRPTKVYFSKTLTDYTLNFWYTPDQTYTFHYTQIIRLQDLDNIANNPDFPVEWTQALIYGLAAELAPEYGLPIAERQDLRNESLIKRQSAWFGTKETGSFYMSPKKR